MHSIAIIIVTLAGEDEKICSKTSKLQEGRLVKSWPTVTLECIQYSSSADMARAVLYP